MKKKLLIITALALSVLSLSPMSSGALFYHTNSDDVVKGWTDGCTELDPKYNCLFNWERSAGKSDDDVAVYMNPSRTCATVLYEIGMTKSCFIPAEGVTLSQINEALEQNFEAVEVGTPADTWYEYPKATDWTEDINGKTYYLLNYVRDRNREISSFLKEEGLITDYILQKGFYSKRDVWFEQILYYEFYTEDGIAVCKEIADYVAESDVAVPVYYTSDYYGEISVVDNIDDAKYMKLETPEGASLEEQLDIALDVYEKFGRPTSGVSPAIASRSSDGVTIDLYNAVDGDANEDGEVDIADATRILQAIGNSDKYGLTPQGEYNADVNCSGGVTALDALEIQRLDAERG